LNRKPVLAAAAQARSKIKKVIACPWLMSAVWDYKAVLAVLRRTLGNAKSLVEE
jgi:hypothetical protein